jgi:hypothetical protein
VCPHLSAEAAAEKDEWLKGTAWAAEQKKKAAGQKLS